MISLRKQILQQVQWLTQRLMEETSASCVRLRFSRLRLAAILPCSYYCSQEMQEAQPSRETMRPARLSNAVEQVRDFATNQDFCFGALAHYFLLIFELSVQDKAHLADIKDAPWLSVQRPFFAEMCISVVRPALTSVRASVFFNLVGEVSHGGPRPQNRDVGRLGLRW